MTETDFDYENGLIGLLDIVFTEESPTRIVAQMPITPQVLQPFGFVHGGATLALLESAASRGAELAADLSVERPFGTHIDVRHRKSGVAGTLRGVATLESEESDDHSRIQHWHVEAIDDAGDVCSVGTMTAKIVSLDYLAEKQRRRAQQGADTDSGSVK